MFCPETWKFSPPASSFLPKKGDLKERCDPCTNIIKDHHFNHLISLVIPDTPSLPETLQEELTGDCDYYRVENVYSYELVNYDFINAFVKQGCVTILSDGTRIDADDCVAVTPSGHLVLSLNRKTYQELGIEGKPSFFSQKTPTRYVIRLDLKQECFQPGKKNYEKVCKCLAENFKTKYNLLVAWEPPEEKVCPSSIAAYFAKRGYKVQLCHPQFKRSHSYNVKVPLLHVEDDLKEMMEWLGMFSIGADLDNEAPDNFLNTYQYPENCQEFGNVALLQGTGYYTNKQILRLFDELSHDGSWMPYAEFGGNLHGQAQALANLVKSTTEKRQYICQRKGIPWISLYVQGFSDCPVNWGLREHQFYTNGDNNYVIFLRPDESFVSCTYLSSSKRPKSHKSLGKK